MNYFYKGKVDDIPVKVIIIQYADNGRRVEIIRENRIQNRMTYAGFWVCSNELIEKIN